MKNKLFLNKEFKKKKNIEKNLNDFLEKNK